MVKDRLLELKEAMFSIAVMLSLLIVLAAIVAHTMMSSRIDKALGICRQREDGFGKTPVAEVHHYHTVTETLTQIETLKTTITIEVITQSAHNTMTLHLNPMSSVTTANTAKVPEQTATITSLPTALCASHHCTVQSEKPRILTIIKYAGRTFVWMGIGTLLIVYYVSHKFQIIGSSIIMFGILLFLIILLYIWAALYAVVKYLVME